MKRKGRKPKPPVVDARVLLIVFKGLAEDTAESIGMENLLQEMFWIMSQFGKVQKVSNFLRDNKVQLLVQFAESSCADTAMGYLNCREYSQSIPDSSETSVFKFAIVHSSVSQLTFKKQDDKNKDYEEQNLLIEKGELASPLDFVWGENKGNGWLCPRQEESSKGCIPTSTGASLPKGEVGSCIYLSYAQDFKVTAENLFRVCGQYGSVIAAKILQKHDGKAIVQYASKDEADVARKKLDGVTVGGKKFVAKQSHHPNALNWNGEQSENEPKLFSQLDDLPCESVPNMYQPSRVVWIRSIDQTLATAMTESLSKQSLPLPTHQECDGASATFTFKKVEEAFLCIAHFNGTQPEGFPQRICMGFAYDPDPPSSPTKPTAKEKKAANRQKNGTDVPNRIEDFLKTCSFEPTEERDIKKKLRDNGYDLATDLYGVSNSKIETLGIKPGHANRMLQKAMAVYRTMHNVGPYLDPYLALWGQPRSCTTPTNGNRGESEWDELPNSERTATAPIPNRQYIDSVVQSIMASTRVMTDPMQPVGNTGFDSGGMFGYTRKLDTDEMPKRHETAPARSQTIDDVDKLLPAERREHTAPVGPGPEISLIAEPRNFDDDVADNYIRHMTAPEQKEDDMTSILDTVPSDWRRCETTPNG
eukprot:TRINITY_DN20873_c0_g1_i1.p1 TRINITY_DN20873_c0_g1~~TRINITY_DN20873_c0_g1_i1.p1  ORF type:complete len:670 (+),score=134.51 TRINITY_DN20873_c0_g1_i1:75-2012(+)